MSRFDWSMVLATLSLILIAILMGCKPWNRLKREIVERIDIDISVDYCQRGTGSAGSDDEKSCSPGRSALAEPGVTILELDNVEEIIS